MKKIFKTKDSILYKYNNEIEEDIITQGIEKGKKIINNLCEINDLAENVYFLDKYFSTITIVSKEEHIVVNEDLVDRNMYMLADEDDYSFFDLDYIGCRLTYYYDCIIEAREENNSLFLDITFRFFETKEDAFSIEKTLFTKAIK